MCIAILANVRLLPEILRWEAINMALKMLYTPKSDHAKEENLFKTQNDKHQRKLQEPLFTMWEHTYESMKKTR